MLKIIVILLLSLLLVLPTKNVLTLARDTATVNLSIKPKKTIFSYTYTPPPNLKKIKSRAVGMGSRGCNRADLAGAGLRLFIPKDHVGLTISGHPTFFWYVFTNSAIKVRFTLVDPEKIDPIIDVQKEVSKVGIEKLQLPPDMPELEQRKLYQWSVSLVCNEKKPSQNVSAYSWIERVPQSTSLKEQLKLGYVSKAAIYAREGIWFDTIAEAFNYDPNSQALISLINKFNSE